MDINRGMRFIGRSGPGAKDRGIGSNTGARKFVQGNTTDNTPKVKLPDLGDLLKRGKGMITGK